MIPAAPSRTKDGSDFEWDYPCNRIQASSTPKSFILADNVYNIIYIDGHVCPLTNVKQPDCVQTHRNAATIAFLRAFLYCVMTRNVTFRFTLGKLRGETLRAIREAEDVAAD